MKRLGADGRMVPVKRAPSPPVSRQAQVKQELKQTLQARRDARQRTLFPSGAWLKVKEWQREHLLKLDPAGAAPATRDEIISARYHVKLCEEWFAKFKQALDAAEEANRKRVG